MQLAHYVGNPSPTGGVTVKDLLWADCEAWGEDIYVIKGVRGRFDTGFFFGEGGLRGLTCVAVTVSAAACVACSHVEGHEGGVLQGPAGEGGEDGQPGTLFEGKQTWGPLS